MPARCSPRWPAGMRTARRRQLPVTHKDYMAEYKDRVVDLGPNLEGTGSVW